MTRAIKTVRTIYCVGCSREVEARLTNGGEIYPHRPDLASLPFWKCDKCDNYVGCHHKSSEPTKPKGIIPTKEVRGYRFKLHRLIDPMWQKTNNPKQMRRKLYAMMSTELGYTYHTGDVATKEMFDAAVAAAEKIKESYRWKKTTGAS